MIHILRATDLWKKPELAASMFADRRKQFSERLKWPVRVDGFGYERDEYDSENPIYVIVEGDDGLHAGSMRILPTIGKTMLNDHFPETTNGNVVQDRLVWECTRFCLAPGQHGFVASSLLVAGARLIKEAGLKKLVAIFDVRMTRLYRRSGVEPEVIGVHKYEHGRVLAGYWSFDEERYKGLLLKSKLDPLMLELAFANVNLPWL
jgi:acyl homoserine lactone synthase